MGKRIERAPKGRNAEAGRNVSKVSRESDTLAEPSSMPLDESFQMPDGWWPSGRVRRVLVESDDGRRPPFVAYQLEGPEAPEIDWYDEETSPLGETQHVAVVKRRCAAGDQEAKRQGARHLLSRKAVSAEFERAYDAAMDDQAADQAERARLMAQQEREIAAMEAEVLDVVARREEPEAKPLAWMASFTDEHSSRAMSLVEAAVCSRRRELVSDKSAEAAARIKREARMLADAFPEWAKLVEVTASEIETFARLAPKLKDEEIEQDRARMRRDHRRALEAHTYVSKQQAERIVEAIGSIRIAAQPLALGKDPASADPEAIKDLRERMNGIVDLMPDQEDRDQVRGDLGKLPDQQILGILDEMARPEAPYKNSKRGGAAWDKLRQRNELRRAAGQKPVTPISRAKQARVCYPILRALKLLPSGDAVNAVVEALDDGWVPRESHWGLNVRDRRSDQQPSVKTAAVSTETRSAVTAAVIGHRVRRDAASSQRPHSRKAARRSS